jgi:hypothetical protein
MKFLSIILLLSVGFNLAKAQNDYRLVKDHSNNFKLELPSVWNFLPITEDEFRIDVALPATSEEARLYNKCFDSVVFYIERYKGSLQEVLKQHHYVVRNDSVYKTEGKQWKYLPYNLRNGYKAIVAPKSIKIDCALYTGKNKTNGVADEIFIWQPNTTKVIVIKTNGKPLDADVKTKILTSFKFI